MTIYYYRFLFPFRVVVMVGRTTQQLANFSVSEVLRQTERRAVTATLAHPLKLNFPSDFRAVCLLCLLFTSHSLIYAAIEAILICFHPATKKSL